VGAAVRRKWGIFTLCCCLLHGCAFGSRVLERSYGPYYESLRHVDEEELLRNLVHMRYNESTGSLDIASIAAQYEISGQAEARPFFIAPNPSNSNIVFKTFTSILPDISAMGANRPTISFVPGDDSEAIRRFLTPITAETLTFLIQTGWPPATIIRLYVAALNGVSNDNSGNHPDCEAAVDVARFERVVDLLRSAGDRQILSIRSHEYFTEVSGALPADGITPAVAVQAAKDGFELQPRPDGKTWAVVRRDRRLVIEVTANSERDPELLELEEMLNLIPGRARYDMVVTPGRVPDPLRHPTPPTAELRLMPRSTAQVYLYLAKGVRVPPDHVTCGLVFPMAGEGHDATAGMFEVNSSKCCKVPHSAYVAVRYRGWWYYIDERDAQSKETFALVLQLSRLDLRRRPPGGGPLLTLPAGR
jgi:hypothetical protein